MDGRRGCLAAWVLSFFLGCGGGSDGESGTVALLAGDSPTDALSSLSLTVESVTFTRLDGSTTQNLLAGPRTFDFLSLDRRQALVSLTPVGVGTYTRATVSVDPASIVARDRDGALVPVSVVSASDDDGFSGPSSSDMAVTDRSLRVVSIDVDLAGSLEEDSGGGGLFFDLRIRARQEDALRPLDEVRGTVSAIDRGSSSFDLQISDDEASGRSFGTVRVVVEDSDFLVDAFGVPFPTAADFLSALRAGTEVEVEGAIGPDGRIDASACELEDGVLSPIEIRGTIASIDQVALTLDLILSGVEKGEDLAAPVLAGLGNPGVLTISFQPGTPVENESGGVPLTTAALEPGFQVDVRFSTFAPPMPFPASAFEVDSPSGEYDGVVTDVSGLPDSVVVTLDADDEAVRNGLVTAPVTVDLTAGPDIFLLGVSDLLLAPSDLMDGLEVKVRGELSGPPAGATVTPEAIRVEPGALAGVVTAVDDATSTLTVSVTKIDDPFGGPPLPNPVDVSIPAEAVIVEGDNEMTFADLSALFAGLSPGEIVEVVLSGIGTPSGSVLGYVLDVEVK